MPPPSTVVARGAEVLATSAQLIGAIALVWTESWRIEKMKEQMLELVGLDADAARKLASTNTRSACASGSASLMH